MNFLGLPSLGSQRWPTAAGISQPDRSHDRSQLAVQPWPGCLGETDHDSREVADRYGGVVCHQTHSADGEARLTMESVTQRVAFKMFMERISRLSAAALLVILNASGAINADAGVPGPRRFDPIPSSSPMQRETPIQVLVSKQILTSGHVTYHYRVVNGNPFPVARVTLGYDEAYGVNELSVTPLGSDFEKASAVGALSPPGWIFHLAPTEEDSLFAIEWDAEPLSGALPGAKSLDGFSVTLDSEDEAYERGHWLINTTSNDDDYPHTWFVLPEAKSTLPPSSIQAQSGIKVSPWTGGDSIRVEVEPGNEGRVTAQMYNSAGRRVRLLHAAWMSAGPHDVLWDCRNDSGAEMPDGEYFVRVWTRRGLRQARVMLERNGGARGARPKENSREPSASRAKDDGGKSSGDVMIVHAKGVQEEPAFLLAPGKGRIVLGGTLLEGPYQLRKVEGRLTVNGFALPPRPAPEAPLLSHEGTAIAALVRRITSLRDSLQHAGADPGVTAGRVEETCAQSGLTEGVSVVGATAQIKFKNGLTFGLLLRKPESVAEQATGHNRRERDLAELKELQNYIAMGCVVFFVDTNVRHIASPRERQEGTGSRGRRA